MVKEAHAWGGHAERQLSPEPLLQPLSEQSTLSIPTENRLDVSATSCHEGRRHCSLTEAAPARVRSVWSPAPASRTLSQLFLSFLHLRPPPARSHSSPVIQVSSLVLLNLPDQLSWTIKKAER